MGTGAEGEVSLLKGGKGWNRLYKTLSVMLIVVLTGCSSKKSLSFEGIPLDGSIDTFSAGLAKKGFVPGKDDDGKQRKLDGMYLGRYCSVYVFGTPVTGRTYKVRVDLQQEPHDSIRYSYERLRRDFAMQYGTGASKYRQFRNSARFLFNEARLVREPGPDDYTLYRTPWGTVTIEVESDYFSIIYTDSRNYGLFLKEGGRSDDTGDLN
jgi:hypothetical protein